MVIDEATRLLLRQEQDQATAKAVRSIALLDFCLVERVWIASLSSPRSVAIGKLHTAWRTLACPGCRSMWVSAGHMLRLDSGQQGRQVVYITRGVRCQLSISRSGHDSACLMLIAASWAPQALLALPFEHLGKMETEMEKWGKGKMGKWEMEKWEKRGPVTHFSFPLPFAFCGCTSGTMREQMLLKNGAER